jgi:hypothetical protein
VVPFLGNTGDKSTFFLKILNLIFSPISTCLAYVWKL